VFVSPRGELYVLWREVDEHSAQYVAAKRFCRRALRHTQAFISCFDAVRQHLRSQTPD
jgi:hypothetical protein